MTTADPREQLARFRRHLAVTIDQERANAAAHRREGHRTAAEMVDDRVKGLEQALFILDLYMPTDTADGEQPKAVR